MSEPQYISCDEVKRRLHCARGHVIKLAADGLIGTRVLPGYAKPRYSAQDVERIRREAINPARSVETPTTPKPRRSDAIIN